eukprot:9484455-Pyramimonas_sp.AAC.1
MSCPRQSQIEYEDGPLHTRSHGSKLGLPLTSHTFETLGVSGGTVALRYYLGFACYVLRVNGESPISHADMRILRAQTWRLLTVNLKSGRRRRSRRICTAD